MSVWLDAACTVPPRGLASNLFVLFGQRFGFGDERMWGGYANPSSMMYIFTPTDEAPAETYQVRAFRNFLSDEYDAPFADGSVVRISNPLGPVSVDGFTQFFK